MSAENPLNGLMELYPKGLAVHFRRLLTNEPLFYIAHKQLLHCFLVRAAQHLHECPHEFFSHLHTDLQTAEQREPVNSPAFLKTLVANAQPFITAHVNHNHPQSHVGDITGHLKRVFLSQGYQSSLKAEEADKTKPKSIAMPSSTQEQEGVWAAEQAAHTHGSSRSARCFQPGS